MISDPEVLRLALARQLSLWVRVVGQVLARQAERSTLWPRKSRAQVHSARYSARDLSHTRREAHSVPEVFVVYTESESFLLEAWMAMVGQALVPRGRSWAVRVVSLTAGLFGVVLLAAYTANLAAILTDTSASKAISRSEPAHLFVCWYVSSGHACTKQCVPDCLHGPKAALSREVHAYTDRIPATAEGATVGVCTACKPLCLCSKPPIMSVSSCGALSHIAAAYSASFRVDIDLMNWLYYH